MAEWVAFDWLLGSPESFFFAMVVITTVLTLLATREISVTVLVGLLTLIYAGYSGLSLITGIMYVLVVLITVMAGSKIYAVTFGDGL